MTNPKFKKFKPASKKIRLKIDNKPKTPTIFSYQKGYIDNKLALRFLKRDKKREIVYETLISPKKDSWESKSDVGIWDVIREFGGQSPEQARFQREECLMEIVRSYFEKLGYTIEFEPRLDHNTPDVLVTKGKHLCYIELKAYFRKTIVGEPEVAQLLKYYSIAQNFSEITEKVAAGEIYPPKFMLIHSGKLIPFSENSLFNGELKEIHSKEKMKKFIDKKYREHLKELGRPNNMESRDTRFIYYKAADKFKKYSVDFEQPPKVQQLNKPKRLDRLIEAQNEFDIFLIPSRIFSQILFLANLRHERTKFTRLRNSWLERLILDKSHLDFESK